MDNCSIKPYGSTKTWEVITNLEEGDGIKSMKLLNLITDEKFVQFVNNDQKVGNINPQKINYDSISSELDRVINNKNVIKRLIKSYKISKVFDPKNTSVISNSKGTYFFANRQVLEDAIDMCSGALFDIYYEANVNSRDNVDFKTYAIQYLIDNINQEVIRNYARMQGITNEDEITNYVVSFYQNKPYVGYNGIVVEWTLDYNKFFDILNKIENSNDIIAKNFANLSKTLNSYKEDKNEAIKTYAQRFLSEVFATKRISSLYSVKDEFDIEGSLGDYVYTNDDGVVDTSFADDSIVSTKQWFIDSIKTSSDKFAGNETKLYFNSLFKLTSVENNFNDIKRDNSFGYAERHNYSECNNQIFTIMNEYGGFKSLEDFIIALEQYANNVPEFRAFAKVANDFKNNKDLAYKIFTDLRNVVIDKIRASIIDGNSIEVSQANANNNSESAGTFKLRNNISSAILKIQHGDKLELLKSIRSKFVSNKKAGTLTDEIRQSTVNALKEVYKQYFPDLDTYLLESYINNNNIRYNPEAKKDIASKDNNISELIDYMIDIVDECLSSMYSYNVQKTEQDKIRKENKGIAIENEWRDSSQPPIPYKAIPKISLINTKLETVVSRIARQLVKFAPSKAEYNSKNINRKQQADVTYNNYISYVTNAMKDKNSILHFIASKFKGSNLRYSNLIVGPKLNVFSYSMNGEEFNVVPTEKTVTRNNQKTQELVASRVIRMKLIDGIQDLVDNVGEDYTRMPDIDYFGLGFAAYFKGINDYYKYLSTGNLYEDTAYYIMPTPSDAPKNFMISLPKYDKESEQIIAISNIIKAQIFDALKAAIRVGRANSTKDLIDHYDYAVGKSNWKDLTGNIFKFKNLFNFNGAIDVSSRINEIVNTYFGDLKTDFEKIAKDINYDTNSHKNAKLPNNTDLEEAIRTIAKDWIKVAKEESVKKTAKYKPVFDILKANNKDFEDYYINYYIAQSTIDDLFRGSYNYYKNEQTVVKRDKQVQAGGKLYGNVNFAQSYSYSPAVVDSQELLTQAIEDEEGNIKTYQTYDYNNNPVSLRTGFNAITIKNSIKHSAFVKDIYDSLIRAGETHEVAKALSEPFGYEQTDNDGATTINDAQSYITIWEAARRIKMRGDYPQYAELLEKLTDRTTKIEELDHEELANFIQVMKHFYYDQYYDEQYDMEVSRQIKNAEFVIIPKMFGHYEINSDGEEIYVPDSSLGELVKFMAENDIDQVNTQETSKATNYDVVEFWDNDGVLAKNTPAELTQYIIDRKKKGYSIIKPFSYSHLYIQQDVPQHMQDVKNKAGIQVIKKILDNITDNFNKDGLTQKEIDLNNAALKAKNDFIEAYITNIRKDFENLMQEYGVKFDKNGNIVGSLTDNINFDKVYAAARKEAERLGIDTNTLDYLTPINGEPIMPSFMNIVGSKIESIANSRFNAVITRQKLPGWHAAQITSVGFEGLIQQFKKENIKKAKVIENDKGQRVVLNYHAGDNIVEIMLPAWTKNMLGQNIEDIDQEALEMIGYRIPTEGKQSMAIFKVVGFLPESLGSTVVVPDEWVTQTGSDFDIDTIYAITKETYLDKDGKIKVVKYDETKSAYENSRAARNTRIVESMITILKSPMATAENLSRSNFDDIKDANKWVSEKKGSDKEAIHPYDLFTQIQFRRNSMGGATLKGISVMLDTAESIFNVAKAYFPEGGVRVVYDKNEANIDNLEKAYELNISPTGARTINHNLLGWSNNNNRNGNGQFITVASSHTTAHILDAVKEGSIENENEYTFQAFKLLFNLGIDAKTAILWIRQPGVTEIVNAYYNTNSVFIKDFGNPIHLAIKNIAVKLGLKVNQYTPINTVIKDLQNKYSDRFAKIFNSGYGTSLISLNENTNEQGVLNINVPLMLDRFKSDSETLKTEEDKLLFDLGMILNFNYINNQATTMMNYAKVLNADKFGADQTIFGTREYINNVAEMLSTGEADKIESAEGKTNLINAIYPSFASAIKYIETPKGFMPNIDASKYFEDSANKKSVYPIIEAFFKYSTVSSYVVNSLLFPTEVGALNRTSFYDAVRGLKLYINRYNEETHNVFKKYAISAFIDVIPFFSANVGLDNKNRIIVEDVLETPVKDTYIDETINMYNEFKRLYGYGREENKQFNVIDLNNPTEDELKEYKKLSPAEKVDFIKRHLLNSERSVFDYIETRLINYRELKDSGDTAQTIRFIDNNLDREEIYRLFEESFFNSNSLIKLAAIDIIKYAFVVEGNQYRFGNVSKIIKNDTLLEEGADVITAIKQIPYYDNLNTLFYDLNLYEKFIQSHSTELGLRTIKVITKVNGKQKVNFARYKPKGYDYLKNSIIYKYDKYSDFNHLAELGLIKDINGRKVLTESYININFNNKTTLYKLLEKEGFVYFVPLNKLLPNEVTDLSVLNSNNIHPISKYWEWFVNADYEQNPVVVKEVGNTIVEIDLSNKENVSKFFAEEQAKRTTNDISETFIEDIVGKAPIGTSKMALFADNIDVRLGNTKLQSAIFYSGNPDVNKKFEDGKSVIQTIRNENEGDIQYTIQRRKLTKTEKENKDIQNFLNKNRISPESSNFYYVQKFVPKKAESVDEVPVDAHAAVNFDRIDLSTKTKLAQKELFDLDKRSRNDEQAKKIFERIHIKGVDFDSIESIAQHSEDIIREATRYYAYKSRQLKNRLSNYKGIGVSVTDPRVIELIKNNKQERQEYLELLMDASTFGKSFNIINDISLDNFTEDTQKDIKEVQRAIQDITNDILLKQMQDIVIKNVYEPLSTNINIREEISSLKDYLFKDAILTDRLFQDAQEIEIPLVQIILKEAYSRVAAEKMATEKEIVDTMRQINKLIEDANKAGTPIDWDKIISKTTGKFLVDFDEQWYKDYKQLDDKVQDTYIEYGKYSKEYRLAKYELNEWLNQHANQKYVNSFYKELNDNVKTMLSDDNIDVYLQYLKLKDEKTTLLSLTSKSARTPEDQAAIDDINKQLFLLREYTDENGNDIPSRKANKALYNFINRYNEIKSEYFVKEEREGFAEDLQYYLDIIKRKQIRNANGQIIISEQDLLLDPEYANAKRWLAENTMRIFDAEFKKNITDSFATLRGTRQIPNVFENIYKKDKYDYKGTINGALFTEDEIARIKEQQEIGYMIDSNDNNTGIARLLRNRNDNGIIYTSDFYKRLKNNNRREDIKSIRETVSKINNILSLAKAENGKIYLSRLTKEQLEELDELYIVYHSLVGLFRETSSNKEVAAFFAKNVEIKTDNEPFEWDKLEIKDRDPNYIKAWRKVAYGRKYDEDGNAVGYELNDTINEDIYGYLLPKDLQINPDGTFSGNGARFVDVEKTKAKKFIDEAIEFRNTEYFKEEWDKAARENRLEDFMAKNMVYNPYTGKLEPIRIWTELVPKENYLDKQTYVANYDNTTPTPYAHTINPNYQKYKYKYNGSAKYKKDYGRTKYEQAISDLMLEKYYKFGQKNLSAHKFTSNLMFPRRGVADGSLINRTKQLLNAFGFGYAINDDRFQANSIGYEYDRINNLPMTEQLKGSGYKEIKKLPLRQDFETDEQYKEALKETIQYNRIAKEDNDKLDVAIMDRDYKALFETFLKQAVHTNAVEDTKLDLYFLLDWLRNNADAVKTQGFGGLLKNALNSTRDLNVAATEKPDTAIKMVETWVKRFLFDEFKTKNRFDALAGFAQNFASAKYMMINIPGGIGNVLTGTFNIMQERTAGEFFGHADWESAKFKYYMQNIPGFVRNAFSGTTDNLIDGIIKMMGIIDYNGISEVSREKNYTEFVNRLRDFGYIQQTSGEHFLQNTAMLAMMISNRIYKDEKGNTVIGNITDYTRMLYIKAMQSILEDNPALSKLYDSFRKELLQDENKVKDYLWFKSDINSDFLITIGKDKENRKYAKLYQDKIKSLENEAKKEFETKPRVIDQFELDNPTKGIAQIKADSELTWEMLGKFKAKAVSVNKKINGVYDKLGAGGIESMWVFGSLAMQYHKHLYMNIMKRYRTTGYWNESRQAVEHGFIVDLWNLATAEFKDFKKNAIARNQTPEDNQLHFVEAIQELCRATIDTVFNLQFRYNTLNPWQRANIRRVVGSLYYMFGGLALGFAASCALLAMGGGDDDDNAYTLMANLALYEADDVLTQVQAFELGLPGSTDKLWSNPIAIMSTGEELSKLAGFIAKYIIQGEDFDVTYTNGRYKGENKFKVQLLKQIPVYSRVDRLLDLNRNNKYYKLNDNLMSFIPMKDITKWIME